MNPVSSSGLLPSPKARWIWDRSNRTGYHYYLRARRTFRVNHPGEGLLLITADAQYQAWLNGQPIGHGPAKSAEGARSVDLHDLSQALRAGENTLEVLALSIGVGTMNYCLGEAGLLFEIQMGSRRVYSDQRTQVRREPSRLRPTARRWILPCVEDVDASAKALPWKPAKRVTKAIALYPRRVPLPTREAIYPESRVSIDRVELPNFSVSFRIKSTLVTEEERLLQNTYSTRATLRLPLYSARPQTLQLTPSLGSVAWSLDDKPVVRGSGWLLWRPEDNHPRIRLKAGRNDLVGEHLKNHFEDIHLAGFSKADIRVGALEISGEDGKAAKVAPLLFANPHDLAVGAARTETGAVKRTLWDLGRVHNGWIAFEADGDAGDAVLLSFFEGMEAGSPPRIQWPDGCNNALVYRLKKGKQSFESFFPYGVRYIALHEIKGAPRISNLRLLKATCTEKPVGVLRTDQPLLNRIHQMCVQTIEASTDDTYTDCPTFEQVNWNFDNRLTCLGDMLISGDYAIARNSILLFAEDRTHKGLVASQTPSAWDLRIPLYSFQWILWCWDYYWHSGDVAFVRQIFPRVKRGIEEALGRIGPKGLMAWPNAWHFVEWGKGRDDNHDVNAAEQAGLLAALDAAAKLAAAIRKPWNFNPARKNLAAAIRRHLWNPDSRYFSDSLHGDGALSPVSSQTTNAIMALHGAGTVSWAKSLASTFANGQSSLLPFGSPLGLHPIMELLDQHRHSDALFKLIEERWGQMAASGDGTTWEHFAEFGHGGWPTRSRCHPLTTYVAKYLVKYILGVESVEPGFAAVRIAPRPPRSMRSGSGAVHTPHGPLSISWLRKDGELRLEVDAPKGIRILRSNR